MAAIGDCDSPDLHRSSPATPQTTKIEIAPLLFLRRLPADRCSDDGPDPELHPEHFAHPARLGPRGHSRLPSGQRLPGRASALRPRSGGLQIADIIATPRGGVPAALNFLF